ncbi:hypothetical protein CCR75_004550 [Bremia lactucae]|uniref:Uncharacterized protein n=1 Tax=Bremia lactucae TaxID=4779 RepID=A0A976NY10_BRELC|nr:hypothetical protein CCR75_004550 [Bremia lactucae]
MATLFACITSGSPVASEPYVPGLAPVDMAAPKLRGKNAATTNGDTENRINWFFWKTTDEMLKSKIKQQIGLMDQLKLRPYDKKIIQALEKLDPKIEKLLKKYRK